MELHELRDIVLRHEKSISSLDNWAMGTEKRVTSLELASNVFVEVQLSLERLNMSSKHMGEKIDLLTKAVEKISDENQKQHEELSARIEKIEKGPGTSWEKAKWIIISGLLGGIAMYIVGRFIG